MVQADKRMKARNTYKRYKTISIAFIMLAYITFLGLLIESFKYKDFILKHFMISVDVLILLVFIGGTIVAVFPKEKKDQHTYLIKKYLVNYIKYLLLPLIVFFLYFNLQNALNYSNYVFSQYHVQPKLLLRPITLGIYLVTFLTIRDKLVTIFDPVKRPKVISYVIKHKSSGRAYYQNILFMGLMMLVAVFAIYNLFIDVSGVLSNYAIIANKWTMREDEKYEYIMRSKYGYFFDYIMFVKKNTPENSTILLPPQQYPWQLEGNQRLVRSFLYPRTLYSAHEINFPDDFDYVLLTWGSDVFSSGKKSPYGWPKESLNAKEIYIYDANTDTYQVYFDKYEPAKFMKEGVYGLIKI